MIIIVYMETSLLKKIKFFIFSVVIRFNIIILIKKRRMASLKKKIILNYKIGQRIRCIYTCTSGSCARFGIHYYIGSSNDTSHYITYILADTEIAWVCAN